MFALFRESPAQKSQDCEGTQPNDPLLSPRPRRQVDRVAVRSVFLMGQSRLLPAVGRSAASSRAAAIKSHDPICCLVTAAIRYLRHAGRSWESERQRRNEHPTPLHRPLAYGRGRRSRVVPLPDIRLHSCSSVNARAHEVGANSCNNASRVWKETGLDTSRSKPASFALVCTSALL